MALSSGSRNLVQMLAGWCLAIGVSAVAITHGDDIRAMLGVKYAGPDESGEMPRGRVAQTTKGDRTVVLKAGPNGHFETTVSINGRRIDVMVDTGATLVALTYEDAEASGIFPRDSDFKYKVNTANGVARVAAVTLDQVSIDDITIRNVNGFVSERGKLNTTLLGMSFLNKLSRAEMSRGTLTLQE